MEQQNQNQNTLSNNNTSILEGINTNKNIQPQQLAPTTITNNIIQKNNKKKYKIFLIIVPSLIILILVSSLIGYKFMGEKLLNKNNATEKTEIMVDKKSLINIFPILQQEYDSGEIDINKYFQELVYYMYDQDKFDTKYQPVSTTFLYNYQDTLIDIISNYKDQLDENTIKVFLDGITLSNVHLGKKTNAQLQSNIVDPVNERCSNNKCNHYESQNTFLGLVQSGEKNPTLTNSEKNSDDGRNNKDHNLDKVYLTSNEHFLIWYTETGNDAITQEQLLNIANGLETTVSDYERIFNIKYKYTPNEDSFISPDTINAKKILKENNIDDRKLNTAMSVYVYECIGNDEFLGGYLNIENAGVVISLLDAIGWFENNGAVAFPYMLLNKTAFKEPDNLTAIYRHELFHHFQHTYCNSQKTRCNTETNFFEAMANFASSTTSKISTSTALNDHATKYTENINKHMLSLDGYYIFPYFYSYTSIVDNWQEILLPAHIAKNPYKTITENTTTEELRNVINDVGYRMLTQNYPYITLKQNKNIETTYEIKLNQTHNFTINQSAINFIELLPATTTVEFENDNKYLTATLYGYKDGQYEKLSQFIDTRGLDELNTDNYLKYEKLYLMITNCDFKDTHSYKIITKNELKLENSIFVTSFKNYQIDMTTELEVYGATTQVKSTGVMDEAHQKQYMNISTTAMGMITLNTEIYYDYATGYNYMSDLKNPNSWTKTKNISKVMDLSVIIDKLTSMQNVEKINNEYYKIKLTKKDIEGLMSMNNVDISTISGDIYVDVYLKDKYITKLFYDFTNLIPEFDKFVMTINFSNYDKAGDVEIPITIIKNAKEQ